MNDGLDTRQTLDRLGEVGQIGEQKCRRRLCWRDQVDAQYIVLMLDQITDNCPTSLPARSGDYELHDREAYEDARPRSGLVPAQPAELREVQVAAAEDADDIRPRRRFDLTSAECGDGRRGRPFSDELG